MHPDALVADLDPAQRDAVTIDGPVVRVLAGAGSGKTRVLTRRVAHRIVTKSIAANRSLVVTFTREAAGELRHRLRSIGLRDEVAAATLHATALAMVRAHARDRGYMPPSLLTRPAAVLGRVAAEHGFDVDTRLALAEIDWARASRLSAARYEAEADDRGRRPPLPITSMAALMARYEQHKHDRRLADFNDLLVEAGQLIRKDVDFGSAQRWKHRHLFVDEFQDLTPLQYWYVQALAGPDPDLFVVGDPNQSIYGWNGSDPGLLEQLDDDYPIVRTVRLDVNYRCTPEIVTAAGALLDGPGLRPSRPGGTEIVVTPAADERAECDLVARLVRDSHAPATSWSSIAVLARTRQVATRIAHALVAAGIPASGITDDQRTSREHLQVVLDDLYGDARDVDVARIRYDVVQQLNEAGAHPDAIQLFDEFTALDPAATVADFMAWLESIRPADLAPGADAVAVQTFHAAKGREWPVVIIAGLEEGLVPVFGADDADRLAEEQRLLYVALTRGSDRVHLTWAARRHNRDREPSRWLIPIIEAEQLAEIDHGDALGWRDSLSTARGSLSASGPGNSPFALSGDAAMTLSALEAWRSRAAQAIDMPPEAVIPRASLRAIAQARPRSVDQLVAIPGLGKAMISRFGPAIVATVSQATGSAGTAASD